MTQRSMMNERNQQEERTGQTRKSAASAKPKSKAAASVRIDTGVKTPEQKKAIRKAASAQQRDADRERQRKYAKVPTKKYKNLRTLWAVLLGVAVVSCIGMFLLSGQLVGQFGNGAFYAVMATSYICIFAAFYVDFVLIRKERQRYFDEMEGSKSKEQRRAEKKAAAAQREAKKAAAANPAPAPEKKGFFAKLTGK